tara:strand:- start:384 stop:1064 length:681 start_codon:yes stop_codon:yes gene_type:complete
MEYKVGVYRHGHKNGDALSGKGMSQAISKGSELSDYVLKDVITSPAQRAKDTGLGILIGYVRGKDDGIDTSSVKTDSRLKVLLEYLTGDEQASFKLSYKETKRSLKSFLKLFPSKLYDAAKNVAETIDETIENIGEGEFVAMVSHSPNMAALAYVITKGDIPEGEEEGFLEGVEVSDTHIKIKYSGVEKVVEIEGSLSEMVEKYKEGEESSSDESSEGGEEASSEA